MSRFETMERGAYGETIVLSVRKSGRLWAVTVTSVHARKPSTWSLRIVVPEATVGVSVTSNERSER